MAKTMMTWAIWDSVSNDSSETQPPTLPQQQISYVVTQTNSKNHSLQWSRIRREMREIRR